MRVTLVSYFRLHTILVGSALFLLAGCLTPSETFVGNDDSAAAIPSNAAPSISGNPPAAITIGHVYNFIPTATDTDGDQLTFSVSNLPSWAVFDAATGGLSGQPALGDEGDYAEIVIGVSDGLTTTELRPFSIQVTQSSLGSTSLSLTAPSLNTDGTPVTDLAGFRIYFGTASGLYPNSELIDNPGISIYVVENLAPGTYYFVATAINQSNVESSFSNQVSRIVE